MTLVGMANKTFLLIIDLIPSLIQLYICSHFYVVPVSLRLVEDHRLGKLARVTRRTDERSRIDGIFSVAFI